MSKSRRDIYTLNGIIQNKGPRIAYSTGIIFQLNYQMHKLKN